MIRLRIPAVVALLMLSFVSSAEQTRYIDGHRTLALREAPSSDGTLITFLETGQQMELLESLGPQSYARVRLPDGREGWLPHRFLTDEAPASMQLARAEEALTAERRRVADLEGEVSSLQQQLERAAPALELADQNEALEAQLAEREAELERSLSAYDAERARQRTLMIGGMLVGGGVLFGLILPVLARSRQRRGYGDL